jgi:hypothetical protein
MQNDSHSTPNTIQPIHTFADDVEIARTQHDSSETVSHATAVKVTVKRPRPHLAHEPIIQLANRGANDYLSSDEILSDASNTTSAESTTKPILPTSATPSVEPKSIRAQVGDDSELAKEIATVAERPKKHSILSDSEVVHDASDGIDLPTGTIIKDKKRQRSGIIASISHSVRGWFTADEPAPEPEKITPLPPVVETPLTKAEAPSIPTELIAKPIAEVQVTTPKNDFKTVVETRQRKLTPITSSTLPLVKPVSETPHKSWSHYTDPETLNALHTPNKAETLPPLFTPPPAYKDPIITTARVAVAPAVSVTEIPVPKAPPTLKRVVVNSPTPQPVATSPVVESVQPVIASQPIEPTPTTHAPIVEPTTESQHEPILPVTPVLEKSTTTDNEKLSQLEVQKTSNVETNPITPVPVSPVIEEVLPETSLPPTPVTEPEPIYPIGEFALADEPYESPEEPKAEIVRPKVQADGIRLIPLELKHQKPISRENRLALIMTIIIVATGLGVLTTVQLFRTNTEPNYTVTRPLPPAILAIDAKIPIALTTDRSDLLNDLLNVIRQEQRLIQMYPTALSPRDREEPASATTIINTLTPRISGPFARTISDIAFGGTEAGQPFIVLRVMEFDTAFAGMIEWEKAMSADLAPLFGETVTQSYNTQARAADGLLPATFVDTIIGNRSSRILFDASGAERITYTFVNQNTILITTSRSTLEQLLPFVR